MLPRNLAEFRSWLRAEIAEMDDPNPEDTLPLCEEAAQTIKTARRIAIGLEGGLRGIAVARDARVDDRRVAVLVAPAGCR